MIAGIDHVALAVPDLDAAVAACAQLFGQDCACREQGAAWFVLGNTTLRLEQADGPARMATAAFVVPELDSALRLLARRGVPAEGAPVRWTGADGTETRAVRLDEAATGVSLMLVEGGAPAPRPGIGLDHLVIRTPNPDRAVALYAGRLGLDLRLDRSNPAWGMRLIFMRCGDSVVELAHKLGEEGTGADAFSGLAWRSPDIAADHARLTAAGVPVSELRPGRAAGSRVFTVRDGAALVPSIFIAK